MTMMEPFAPWLRDINRFIAGHNVPAAFIPPADVIVSDRGVTIHMDVPGLTTDDLENDTLTVRGERPFPYQEEGNGEQRVWRHIERRVEIHPGSGEQRVVEGTASEGTATSGAGDGGATEAGNAQSATTAA